MAFDYKKEYKEFYLPPKKPGIIEVPEMNYVAVRGRGNPNEPDGEYQAAMGILYGIAFTIKMSERAGHAIEGYFSYVVPPLEGLWRQQGMQGKEGGFVQCMHVGPYDDEPDTIRRMEEYAGEQGYEVDDTCAENGQEKRWEKGPEWEKNGRDGTPLLRCHHEIYLSDPRRTAPERLRTVIRQPVRPR